MSISSWKCAKNQVVVQRCRIGTASGERSPNQGETTLIGTNILGQLLTSLRDELRRQKGYTGKTVTRYLTGVKTNTLVRNGKPVS